MTSTNPQPSVREAVARVIDPWAGWDRRPSTRYRGTREKYAWDQFYVWDTKHSAICNPDGPQVHTHPWRAMDTPEASEDAARALNAAEDAPWQQSQEDALTKADQIIALVTPGDIPRDDFRRAREALPDGGGSSREPALSDDGGDQCSLATENARLRQALLGYDADEFGRSLYEAFWARNGVKAAEGTPWKDQADAIRKMWRGIAVDAGRYLGRAALSHPDPLTVPETSRQGSSGADIAARVASDLAAGEALRKSEELRRAVTGIADDYMTSERHHPGYVLIPTSKFMELCAAAGEEVGHERPAEPDATAAEERPPSPAAAIHFRMEQAGYTRADLVKIVGTRARAAEILAGKREPSKAHIRRLVDEWGIPARSLLGPAESGDGSPSEARAGNLPPADGDK